MEKTPEKIFARELLRKYLISISDRPAWWYVVKLDDAEPDSFANLCGLNNSELKLLLLTAGLAKQNQNSDSLSFSQTAFNSFIMEHQMDEFVETDNCHLPLFERKSEYVIRVGKAHRQSVGGRRLNARAQYTKLELRRPRMGNKQEKS